MKDFIFKIKKFILLAGDIIGLYLALYLTLAARYGYPVTDKLWERHLLPFSIVFAVWLIIFFINEIYDLKISYNTSSLFSLLVRIFIINGAIAVILFYFFTPFIDTIRPQKVLIIDLAFSLFVIFIWRKIFYNFIKSPNISNNVLIIGHTPLALDLAGQIKRRPQLGYKVIVEATQPESLKAYCQEKNINILISAEDLKDNPQLGKRIFECLSLEIDVYSLAGFYEHITTKIPVEHIENSWFLENLAEHSKKGYEITKRLFDFVSAVIGLIIAIPLSPIIALIIKLESPGPIIFKQKRVGKNGRVFTAMKFRSMVDNAEKHGAQWAAKNDPRVTKFGKIMRKTRLDEIPQLINILRGEMSIVGPRPERPEFVTTLSEKIPFYRERLLVRPGLAGWAQLMGPSYGGSEEETWEKLKYDLYYIKNRNLLLDISIILKTFKLVLGGKGQ